ncbi:MAG TPA: molybdopterin-dependent oxidoreductase [Acidimicrobiia bacterium]|nr:molybdopterin-dependent oxidoreductase [Acidimicrobiia bacterium]
METTTTPQRQHEQRRRAGFAGAAAAGLALGLTELVAGLTTSVPSAIASVGTYVVDYSPPFVKRFAIDVFGTADKGALAIGTVIVAVLIGGLVGRLTLERRWAAPAAFGVFALVGIIATFDQPSYEPIATVLTIVVAAGVGWYTLDRLLAALDEPATEMPTDGVAPMPTRRHFVAGVVGVTGAALGTGLAGRSMIISRSEEVRSSIALPSATVPVDPPASGTSFDVDGLESLLVPNDDFYRIDTALVVPRPDTAGWRLKIKGMVETELEYTLSDLLAMPLHERYVTIACVSNKVGGDLVGNARWTGVLLSDLLERAGVKEGATQIVGRSVDDWTAGFPTELAFDGREPLVAIGMNGEMLPPRHGYPARLIVPGLYGYVSATKWLQEIELTTWEDFDGYWIPRGWSKEGPIKTQSRIDVPQANQTVPAGQVVMAGVAWAPLKGIDRVEVRIDDGEWQDAELTTPLADTAWVQWKHAAELAAGNHQLSVRATDGTGQTQTSAVAEPAPNGATGHHTIRFRTS